MSEKTLTVGSLFSGIPLGGLDLGLERAGMTVIWQAELDPYCSRVLAKHWPAVPNLGDITQIDWSEVPRVDVLAGGYPCQPFSLNGQRRGSDDERHLWPFMLDAIRVLRPRLVVAENVSGHLSLGFDRVLADLASLGLDVEWSTVSACSMGAPQMRHRLFYVAYAAGERRHRQWTELCRTQAQRTHDQSAGRGAHGGRPWTPESRVRGVAYGVPARMERLRALGNAVVPAVAEYVGRLIVAADQERAA